MAKIKLNRKEYGPGQRLSYQEEIFKNKPIVPDPVEYEDIDRAFFDFANTALNFTDDDGKSVPTFTLYSNQRFSEYSQTWEHTDEDGNLLMNFKTVNRENNPNFGTIQGGNYNIPGSNRFTVRIREVMDKNGVECYEVTSMSQPVQVDLVYNLSFVTSKYERLNTFNVEINKLFAAKQYYLKVNGHYMPMVLDNLSDDTTYSIDERKFFIQSASIKLMGYIIPKDDIKVDLRPKRVKLSTNLDVFERAKVSLEYENDTDAVLDINFKNETSKVRFMNDDDMLLKLTSKENANVVKVTVNDEEYDITTWFRVYKGDELKFKITKPRPKKSSYLSFTGKLI